MYPSPFSLVSTEDPTQVFAFGLEIIRDGGEIETAITYRRESNGQNMFGVHSSAAAARDRFGVIAPMTLLRDEELLADG